MMSVSQRELLVGTPDTVNALMARHHVRTCQRVGLVLLSAGLLICSLPGPDLGWLAWIALVPLVIACDALGPLHAAALGFLTGFAANVGLYHWLFGVKGFGLHHFMVLSTFFALYLAAWCAGVAFLKRRGAWLVFTVPALWVVLDYVRAHAGFMAFPWGTLAQTQHRNLAILQIATLTGEYGVTFLVVLGNVALAGIVLQRAWRSAAVTSLVIALVHVVGTFSLLSDRPGHTIRVAAVQPSILLGERNTAAGRAATFDRLTRLTRAAATSSPSLIAWPETAIAGTVRGNPFLAGDLMMLAQEVGTPLVFGVGEVEKFATPDSQGNLDRRAYNAAYVVTPRQGWGAPYIKRVLLPFGEYVPLERFIGWPAWLAPPAFHTVVGDRPRAFTLDDGTPFAPLICWENLFADLVRESVQGGARFLVLLTNDGWFGSTAEPGQHNLASVLRAIENRVPIVVASNTGPSHIIDAYGRVVAQAPRLFSEDVVIGDVRLSSAGTLYTRIGDAFLFIVMGVLALVLVRVCWRHVSAVCKNRDVRAMNTSADGARRHAMRRFLLIGFAVCLWLGGAWPQETLGSGELVGVVADAHGCYGDGPTNATFTSTSAKYVFGGSCWLTHTRLNLDVAAPWTGVGTYDPATGRTQENISVPPPAINQPSRPYGTFQVVMHCSADPWLNPTITCDTIIASADAPLDHMAPNTMGWKQPYPLAPFIIQAIQSMGRPYTSVLTQDAVNRLVAQHRVALAVQQPGGEAQKAVPGQIQIGRPLVPSILFPVNGQNFFAQTPVPIMLAPPPGVPVTLYMVDMESNGHPLCNIPIGPAEAQSKLGYTGFGAGKPPCFLTVPGSYRMRVQVSSPMQSGWSDWVQFTVTSPKIAPFILHRGIEGEQPDESKPPADAPESKSGTHR